MPDQIHDHFIGKDTFRMHDQERKDIKFFCRQLNYLIADFYYSIL